MEIEAILWRRLDVVGHDACHLIRRSDGWLLEGAAVFQHENGPACLAYEVRCDGGWRTQEGVVHGWAGDRPLDFQITRTPDGIWSLNGQVASHLEGCFDLDFAFTPATNLFQLRRVALQVGQAADVPVAWLDAAAGVFDRLHQRYERRTAEEYWYEAPRFGYFALLQVNTVGFVKKYPDLWEEEP
jgi:hypothetical protein